MIVDNHLDLKESLIEDADRFGTTSWSCWEPDLTTVVLGRSSPAEREIDTARCSSENVPVQRRKGGGCSVVLSKGMVVTTIAYPPKSANGAVYDLRRWTTLLSVALEDLGIKELIIRGISDLCIGDKKILGTCLYKSRKGVLFQSSLLVNNDLSLITRYLRRPVRMPSYRRGRPHRDFLTNLANSGYSFSTAILISRISSTLTRHLGTDIQANTEGSAN